MVIQLRDKIAAWEDCVRHRWEKETCKSGEETRKPKQRPCEAVNSRSAWACLCKARQRRKLAASSSFSKLGSCAGTE
jgi:hypothetical protein